MSRSSLVAVKSWRLLTEYGLEMHFFGQWFCFKIYNLNNVQFLISAVIESQYPSRAWTGKGKFYSSAPGGNAALPTFALKFLSLELQENTFLLF